MTSTFTSGGQAEAGTSAGSSNGAGHPVPSSPETQIQPDSSGLRRFAALDGMRAFAVMAVMLFHFGVSWVGGGLLGVDVFFVLSGFLITTLLCRELSRTTTIRLGRFWAQRARRLLPALFVLILGVAAYAFAFSNTIDVSGVRSDAIATLLYVANWHFIFSGQGYFAQAAAPSPLLHTWSLAVEEQYYLIWPLIALFVVRRWGMAKLAVTAGVGALASAALMLSMFVAGFSIDRIYYGTDTRAQALLVGSFLGAIGSHAGEHFTIVPARWTRIKHSGLVWALPGVVGALFLVWAWHALNGQNSFLYHGGFLLVARGRRSRHRHVRHRAHVGRAPVLLPGRPGVHRPDLLRALPLPLAPVPGHQPRPHRPARLPPAGRPPGRHLRRGHRFVVPDRRADPHRPVLPGSSGPGRHRGRGPGHGGGGFGGHGGPGRIDRHHPGQRGRGRTGPTPIAWPPEGRSPGPPPRSTSFCWATRWLSPWASGSRSTR